MSEYTYLGDRWTGLEFAGAQCNAVRRGGKCVRGRNGTMLVNFAGQLVTVVARRLRRNDKLREATG